MPLNAEPTGKAFVAADLNPLSDTQYAGIAFSNATDLRFQIPSSDPSFRHVFYAGTDELVRVGTSSTGQAQLGIGVRRNDAIASNVALDVQGTARISGSLEVDGHFEFDKTGLATIDPGTQRLSATQMPTGLVFLDSNQKLDTSLFPSTPPLQYLRGLSRNVGIGNTSSR